jgi:hypothetical protein
MPLLDHFHEPLWPRRQWHSFHSVWSTFIAADLNKRLPEGYIADPNVQFNIEIDVATLHDGSTPTDLATVWQPPAPVLTLPFTSTTDIVEVLINEYSEGTNVVGAIELVSPANKDRDATRDAFVTKCAGYLQQGIGLIVIDVVTHRKANLHNLIVNRVSTPTPPWDAELYAVAYHAVQMNPNGSVGRSVQELKKNLEIWPHELNIGHPLPALPLCLRGGLCLPLDLETIYVRTCQEFRISMNGK